LCATWVQPRLWALLLPYAQIKLVGTPALPTLLFNLHDAHK